MNTSMLPAILAPANLADAVLFEQLAAELAAELQHAEPGPDGTPPAFDWFGPPIEPPLDPWWPAWLAPEAKYPAPPLRELWHELAGDVTVSTWTRADAAAVREALGEGAALARIEVEPREPAVEGEVVASRDVGWSIEVAGERVNVAPAPLSLPTRAQRLGRWLRDAPRRATRWATGWDGATRSYRRPA